TIFERIVNWPAKLASWFRSSKNAPPKRNFRPEANTTNDSTNDHTSAGISFFENKVMYVDGRTRNAIKILSDDLNYTLDIRTGLIKLSLTLQDRDVVAHVMKDLIDEF